MAARSIELEHVGSVQFFKRKGARSVRLKIDATGKVSVTMPHLVAYETAIDFVREHTPWILEEQGKRSTIIQDGHVVGRVHIVRHSYEPSAAIPTSRVTASQIIISSAQPIEAPEVQQTIRKAAVKALKREAEHFITKRVHDIALLHGYTYSDISIRQLKGRWGSCNHKKELTFNCFLMQLPIHLIDYVIYHELAHTRVLNHSPGFWHELESHVPDARQIRKEMKLYQPTIPARNVS